MRVLGIESTCDETSVACVEDGEHILAHVTTSQVALHNPYGGVVPEIAARQHAKDILPVLHTCLTKSSCCMDNIDLIAVARGPGLIGSLLVGIHAAKTLAWAARKPLVGVNHVEAHLCAALMTHPSSATSFPALGLIVSGGHTSLLYLPQRGSYILLGQTVDDALGEAFDKVAKTLGLGYPGGPLVEQAAVYGDPHKYPFKAGRVKADPYAFSFSGLKTAVLYAYMNGAPEQRQAELPHICASFQQAAWNSLTEKLQRACAEYHPKAVFLGGGVCMNQALRHWLMQHLQLPMFFPDPTLCTDNAAMIAGLGFHLWQKHPLDETFSLTPETKISFQCHKEKS